MSLTWVHSFSGPNVREWLETVATQKVSSITVGRCAYTHFLDKDGFIIDDMIFAVVSETRFLVFQTPR